MSRPWSYILNEITKDAGNAFSNLQSSWDEENISKEEMYKKMNVIRQELQRFWQDKISEEKLLVLKYKIQKIRSEIEIWWEKCFFSEEEKQEFDAFRSVEFTDLLLDCHIRELERLKRRYFRNESLFTLIKKHQDTWKLVVNMDKQLYNPERLFQNRGAQLLQEEKDRKVAQKDLPRLEELVKKETVFFERENGRPFLIYGKTFSEMICYQKELHKENQKVLKSTKKKCCDCNVDPVASAPVNAHKPITVSKLKRKLMSNTPSPVVPHSKQPRIATCNQPVCRPVSNKDFLSKHRLPVRRKLIERSTNIPVMHS